MQAPFSWSRQYQARQAVAARFGKTVFRLPIVRRVREVLVAHVADGARVLEVGAGERAMGAWLAELRRDVRYESCDPDPAGQHEYCTLAETTGPYDCVFAFEVVEHLTLDEIRDWLPRLAALLRPGGKLLLSTPNTFYPPDFLRDATHRTPLCYDELGGLVDLAGLRTIELVRIYHDPVWRKFARRYLFGWLFRLIGIDFARQIVLVAEKPPENSGA